MNIFDLLEQINEVEFSDEEKKLKLIEEKCLNLKSPMVFSEKIGTIEDLTNIIEKIKQNFIDLVEINSVKGNLILTPAKKSSLIKFI